MREFENSQGAIRYLQHDNEVIKERNTHLMQEINKLKVDIQSIRVQNQQMEQDFQMKDTYIMKLEKKLFKVQKQRDELKQMTRSEPALILRENAKLVY